MKLFLGSMMHCPTCELAGMKDDACTHMRCPRCSTSWCYVCGLSVTDCDKSRPEVGRPADDIFLHNRYQTLISRFVYFQIYLFVFLLLIL